MENSLRKTCGLCSKLVGEWQPYRDENIGVGYAVTCDHCGNEMVKLEVLNPDFREDISKVFDLVKNGESDE